MRVVVIALIALAVSITATRSAAEQSAAPGATKAQIKAYFAKTVLLEDLNSNKEAMAKLDDIDCQCDREQKSIILTAWRSAVNSSFEPQEILAELQVSLQQAATKTQIAKLIAQLDKPIGKQILRRERSLMAMPMPQLIEALAKAAPNLSAGNRRADLIFSLIFLKSSMEHLQMQVANSSISFALGLVSLGHGDKPSDQEIIATIDRQTKAARFQLEHLAAAIQGFIYQDLSDKQLTTLMKFHTDKELMKFHKTYANVMGSVMRKHMIKLGHAFANQLKKSDI